jgi:hypothetical protein
MTSHMQTVSEMTNAMLEKAFNVSVTMSSRPIVHHAQKLVKFFCFGIEDNSARSDNYVSCGFQRAQNAVDVILLLKNQLHYYLHTYILPTFKNGISQFNACVVSLR